MQKGQKERKMYKNDKKKEKTWEEIISSGGIQVGGLQALDERNRIEFEMKAVHTPTFCLVISNQKYWHN